MAKPDIYLLSFDQRPIEENYGLSAHCPPTNYVLKPIPTSHVFKRKVYSESNLLQWDNKP